jgi:hypothetical protein
MNDTINQSVIDNARKIVELLKENNNRMSSWDIKLKLGSSNSMLYMAIGYLVSTNKINVYSKDLIYIIELINP